MIEEHIKHLIDVISIGALISSLIGWITPLSIIFTSIWTLGRLIEMWTGRSISQLRKEYMRKNHG